MHAPTHNTHHTPTQYPTPPPPPQALLDERETELKRMQIELEAMQQREQAKTAELMEAGEAAELLSTELERYVGGGGGVVCCMVVLSSAVGVKHVDDDTMQ